MLLVLDSFEHLLSPQEDISAGGQPDGIGLLLEILAAAPEMKLLVTSRERLQLRQEWLLDIHGLRYPRGEENESITDYSAVQLFIENTRRILPGPAGEREQFGEVAQICRLVEGLPLAIELAAASAREVSYREIAGEIARGLEILSTAMRDVPARHRSLRAVLDHSWGLLSQEEQFILDQLSVFQGGFQPDAAQQVAGATGSDLAKLTNKSLMRQDGSGRYSIHNLIRRYAKEKLRSRPEEAEATPKRHCQFYMAFLQEREIARGGDLRQIVGQLSREVDNIRAGWQWAVEQKDSAALAGGLDGLWSFYEIRGWFQEGEAAFRQAVNSLGGSMEKIGNLSQNNRITVGRLLARQGWFCWRLSRYKQSQALFEQGLAIMEQAGPEMRPEVGFMQRQLGLIEWNLGHYLEARRLLKQGQAIALEFGDGFGIILSLFYRGLVALSLGEYPAAKHLFQEALGLSRKHNEQRGIAHWQIGLGWVSWAMGDYAEASELLQESLGICRETNDMLGINFALNNLGAVSYLQGAYETARQHYQESRQFAERTGDLSGLGQALTGLGNVACAQGDYEAAETFLYQAVGTAMGAGLLPEALAALVGLAELLVASRPDGATAGRAVELLKLGLHHPASSRTTKDRAAHLLDELKTQLPPQTITLAQTGKEIKDLEVMVAELLEE
jgi:predicted ATPase